LGEGNYFPFSGWILSTRAGLQSESTDRSCQLRAGGRRLSLAEHKHCYSVQGIFHLPPTTIDGGEKKSEERKNEKKQIS